MLCRIKRTQKPTFHYTSVNADLGLITDSELGKIRFVPGSINAADHVRIVQRFNIIKVPSVLVLQYHITNKKVLHA